MKKIVFATHNLHKFKEIQAIVSSGIELVNLDDINCREDIPENEPTIAGNALAKARYVLENYGYNCFADDTGLEIEALNGEPGVYSARYAGNDATFADNTQKVLRKVKGQTNRKARFKTVIALTLDGREELFEGIVNGTILTQPRGTGGFGYDPIFLPDGYTQTFAEMPLQKKNQISHRALATVQLVNFLNNYPPL